MTQVAPAEPATRPAPPAATGPVRRIRVAAVFVFVLVAVVAISAVHLTQGTSTVGAMDLLRLAIGQDDDNVAAVLVASRLPRLLAGILVGVALGVAGAVLQSVARNSLAAPDTLGIDAGAYFAVVASVAFGFSLPAVSAGGLAFIGGLLAAALVLALSSGGTSGPTRLVLAGSAIAMALDALTMLLLLLYAQETTGLFAWGSGTLVQTDLVAVTQMAPVVVVGLVGCLFMAPKLDILSLGDDAASVLGVDVRRTRAIAIVAAVLLTAAAVTVAGPIGFVGLVAPVAVRLVAPLVPGLMRHRIMLPLAALAGVVIVLGADVLLRAVLGGQAGVQVPTGVVTTVFGALVLIWLARRYRDSGPTRQPPSPHSAALRTARTFRIVVALLVVAVAGGALAGMLLGDTMLRTGDLMNWVNGKSGTAITFVLDQRFPRMLAALLAGAALAIAGATVQAVCRNPLAEPGILGITAGAGVGAVIVITTVTTAGVWTMSGAAGIGALIAFAVVYGLSWRGGGLSSDRLVLIGIGVWSGAMAAITFIIVLTDPWNTALVITWLSGSTYGRTLEQIAPVAVALLALTPIVALARRELDLLALDDDVPRVLGVRLERTRLIALIGAALLTSTAVSAVGVIGFVGLVAPHAARAIVGGRHGRVLPVAALLGALLVSVADTLGRTVIAPAQVPAGILTAVIGAPYFVWLLYRSQASRPLRRRRVHAS